MLVQAHNLQCIMPRWKCIYGAAAVSRAFRLVCFGKTMSSDYTKAYTAQSSKIHLALYGYATILESRRRLVSQITFTEQNIKTLQLLHASVIMARAVTSPKSTIKQYYGRKGGWRQKQWGIWEVKVTLFSLWTVSRNGVKDWLQWARISTDSWHEWLWW